MCKKLSVILVLALAVACTPCYGTLSVWLSGSGQQVSDDTVEHVGARIGFLMGEAKNIEVGVSSEYYPAEDADLPQVWSIYGIYHWSEPITLPQPIPFEFLPKEVTATPYIGARVGMDFDADGVVGGPLLGVVIQDIIFVEYQYNYYSGQLGGALDDDHRIVFGLRWTF